MAKQRDAVSESPDDIVRLVASMKRSERQRIKVHAVRRGMDLEDLAAEWLVERLDAEDRSHAAKDKGRR